MFFFLFFFYQIEDIIFDKNRNQRRETFHLQVITGQAAYEGKSQEELRLEDYRKGLRGPTGGGGKDVFFVFCLTVSLPYIALLFFQFFFDPVYKS